MKRIISLFLALCLLAGCGLAAAEDRVPEGKPWINSNVLGNLPDERPAVEDGFDLYVNYDAYTEARDKGTEAHAALDETDVAGREKTFELCRSATAEYPEDEILRILYGLLTDTEKRDTDGLAPLMAKVDRVKAAETTDDLLALLQEEGFMPCDTFYTFSIAKVDDGSGKVYIRILRKDLLEEMLPAEGEPGELYEGVKDTESAKAALLRMQYSEEEAAALAERMKEYDEYYPVEAAEWPEGKIVTIEQLKERNPLAYAQAVGMGLVKEGPVYAADDPVYLEAASHYFTTENLDLLKAIIALSMYRFSVNYLDEATWKAEGSWDENEDPDKNLYRVLIRIAEIAVNQAYLKHFCPEENREMAMELFEELKDAMRNRLQQNTWMDEESRQRALEKLEQMGMAPVTATGGMFDCEPLKTALQSCTTLLDAAGAGQRFYRQCLMRYAGEPYVRGSRYLPVSFSVMMGNGVYNPETNIIWIGACALNMPGFNTKSKATMLGTLGQHIAHELSHAFDSNEALSDGTGRKPLFSEETMKIFMEKVNAMIGEMNKIEPFEGEMLNGSVKIQELMADVTGISLALDVAKKTEDFDYAEFFSSFAAFFRSCQADREAIAAHSRSSNLHPLPYIRVNYTVAQFDEFYEAFPSVKEGTPMYIAPENRIVIW